MDYEQKYKEALKRAKEWFNPEEPDSYTCIVESIFPELKENEDEKIRKELISFFSEVLDTGTFRGIPTSKVIAWLEKQGEQKIPNEVEPKFKVGDFIVNDYCRGKVIEITNDAYLLDTEQYIPFSYEHSAHLWTIQDAKDGDILVYDGEIFLIKDYTPGQRIIYHCCYDGKNLYKDSIYDSWEKADFDKVHPATKEQRELLFQKMEEAGYSWDFEKKELEKIEQDVIEPDDLIEESYQQQADDLIDMVTEKPAWDEEDERIYKVVLELIDSYSKGTIGGCIIPSNIGRYAKWFKSLKERVQPQPKQEWSEEDIKMIDWLIRCCEKEHKDLCNDKYGHQDIVSDLKRDCRKKWDWLESIKDRAQLKT